MYGWRAIQSQPSVAHVLLALKCAPFSNSSADTWKLVCQIRGDKSDIRMCLTRETLSNMLLFLFLSFSRFELNSIMSNCHCCLNQLIILQLI